MEKIRAMIAKIRDIADRYRMITIWGELIWGYLGVLEEEIGKQEQEKEIIINRLREIANTSDPVTRDHLKNLIGHIESEQYLEPLHNKKTEFIEPRLL